MEIGLGGEEKSPKRRERRGLNPCFSGNRFGRDSVLIGEWKDVRLNPCFSGNRFGRMKLRKPIHNETQSLNPCFSGNRFGSSQCLVLSAALAVRS